MPQASSLSDEVSLTYFKKDFNKYSWGGFKGDMFAGLSVAMLSVPQALAYALVAGLPISTGIFAAIFTAIITALFGSSRHLLSGPSNAISILIQGGISMILFTYYRDITGPDRETLAIQILTQLCLLVGLIQILAGFFKLGRLTNFVSHSVIVGYVAGVALALLINQLFPFLGMDVPVTSTSLFGKSIYIFSHYQLIHWPTAMVGMGSILLLFLFKKINPKIPAGALMLAIVAFSAYCIDYFLIGYTQEKGALINISGISKIIQDIPLVGDARGDGIVPHFTLPFFQPGIMNDLLPVAFAIALLCVIESISTAKSIAANSGQPLSMNQEIFGLGMGNLFSAFIGAMPISGSTSRSTMSFANGAKTRLAAIFNSIFVAIIIFVFGFLVKRIPIASFAALLIVAAANIVNFKQVSLCIKATRSDAYVFILTVLSCIFFSLDMAFYIGVVMSITLYLKKAAAPQLVEFTMDESGNLQCLDHSHPHLPRKIRLIKVEGELFFGAADLFQSTLKTITQDDTTTKVIILQLKNARDMDATSCLALQQLYEFLKGSQRYLIVCGLTQPVWDVLSDSGMIELIGKENLFFFDEKHPHVYLQKAFYRANELINKDTHTEKEINLQPVVIVTSVSEPSSILPNLNKI